VIFVVRAAAVAAGDVKFSADPQLEARLREVARLDLNPPESAVVLCTGEKSQIRALDRTAPILPLRSGLPEKAARNYVRHGTATQFGALEAAAGKVTDACYPRHRHQEFLRFLRQVARPCPARDHTSCAITTRPASTRR